MNAHMVINSPVLAQLHRERKEREARIEAAARKHDAVAAVSNVVRQPFQVRFGQEADAHIMSWKIYGSTKLMRPVDLDVLELDQGAIVPHRSHAVIAGTAAVGLIIRTVANHYGLKVEEMKSHRRTAPLMLPRQVAMYLAKELTTRSFPEIGRQFGSRDHTTIMHGFRKIAARRLVDKSVDDDLNILTEMLLGGLVQIDATEVGSLPRKLVGGDK